MTLLHQPGRLPQKFTGVYWSARDGEESVGCGVTREALVKLASARGLASQNIEEIYLTYRSVIQDLASAKYERRELEPDKQVLVKKTDLGLEPKRAA
ncbi:MAG TPA: DUF1488 family protein [Xanthobacteraceae bacterium]|nr:DUF1488 family protein [Xanthobacteraceae bacterium]